MRNKLWIAILCLAGLVLAAGIAACGNDDDGDDKDEAEVEATVSDFFEAWNNQDADAVLTFFSSEGLGNFFLDPELTPDVVRQNAADYFDPKVEVQRFQNSSVSGDTATTEVDSIQGNTLNLDRISLLKDDDEWKVDNRESLVHDTPDGSRTVAIVGSEFAYDFDAGNVSDGNVAFTFENQGSQLHEAFLVSVTDEFTLDGLLEAGEDGVPPGVIAQIGGAVAAPGQTASLALKDPLAAGRYVFLCFIPDEADGVPHVAKGMYTEFTVPD